jgi:hypothetical protein
MSEGITDVEGEVMNGTLSGIAIIAGLMPLLDRTRPYPPDLRSSLPGPDRDLQDEWMIAHGLESPRRG